MGVGICESIVMTVSTTLICDYFDGKSRDRWLAGQTATASLAALIIIPLGGVLAGRYGWRGPFYVYLYSLLLVAGVAAFIWAFPWARMLALCGLTLVAAVMFYSIITQNANALAALGVVLQFLGEQSGGLLPAFSRLSVVCFAVAAAAILGGIYQAVAPPSMRKSAPVTQPASSDAR